MQKYKCVSAIWIIANTPTPHSWCFSSILLKSNHYFDFYYKILVFSDFELYMHGNRILLFAMDFTLSSLLYYVPGIYIPYLSSTLKLFQVILIPGNSLYLFVSGFIHSTLCLWDLSIFCLTEIYLFCCIMVYCMIIPQFISYSFHLMYAFQ